MTLSLLVAMTLATPPSDQRPGTTAGDLYEGCVRVVDHRPAEGSVTASMNEAVCEVIAAVDLAAAGAMRQSPDAQPPAEAGHYCLPAAIVRESDTLALQRAFIAYVDAHPTARTEDGTVAFERALTDKWPCPQ